MLLSHRSSDALIAVYQDNEKQDIILSDVNEIALDILGYQKEEIYGQSIKVLLPARIADLLSEYVEYEEYGNDVGSVLNKVSSFCLLTKSKEEKSFNVKVQRSTPVDHHDQFHLILQTPQDNRRSEAFRALLKENFKGHEVLDEKTGLPDRASFLKDIELVMFYINKKELDASLAIIELDDMDIHKEAYGESGVATIIRHIAKLCVQNLRSDDKIGLLSNRRIGLILFDAKDDAAKMVLNRLRWLVAANSAIMENGEIASLSIRVAYQTLEAEKTNIDHAIETLEENLDSGAIGSNRVQQAG